MKKVLTPEELSTKARFGFTESGSAIVDCLWMTPAVPLGFIMGFVLLCSAEQEWRCYGGILAPQQALMPEEVGAKFIAATGAKVDRDVAIAMFPSQFYPRDYAWL